MSHMYDTAIAPRHQLSHDMPCPHCGHAPHTYLACSDECSCRPAASHSPGRLFA